MKEKLKDILNRLKSPVTLTAVGAGIISILFNIGLIPAPEPAITVLNAAVGILIVLGILNNPTDKSNF